MATRAQLRTYIQTYRPDIYDWALANLTVTQVNSYLDKNRIGIHADALQAWLDYTANQTGFLAKLHEVLLCIGWAINRVP